MWRVWALASAGLLLAACGSTTTIESGTSSPVPLAPSTAPSSVAPTTPAAPETPGGEVSATPSDEPSVVEAPPGGEVSGGEVSGGPASPGVTGGDEGFAIVSDALSTQGTRWAEVGAQLGDTAVAAIGEERSESNWDVGIAYSSDDGRTWNDGGFVRAKHRQYAESVMLVPDGAVIVGYTELPEFDSFRAFIAVAPEPDFVPVAVDLPAEFRGNVQLTGIQELDGLWLITGSLLTPVGQDQYRASPVIWRSDDEGGTWSRTTVQPGGMREGQVWDAQFGAVWHLFGEYVPAGTDQWEPMWLVSWNGGESWRLVDVPRTRGIQWAFSGMVDDDGNASLVGIDQAVGGDAGSAQVWVGSEADGLWPLGNPRLDVSGGTPEGPFLDGGFLDDGDLVVWGVPQEGNGVQFYIRDGPRLYPGTLLTDGTSRVRAYDVVTDSDSALVLGEVVRSDGTDVVIWRGER
jgi:hypothetical protein